MTTLQTPPIAGPRRIADDLYHDTQSPDEIKELRSRVRDIASRVVAPVAAKIANGDERTDGFPRPNHSRR